MNVETARFHSRWFSESISMRCCRYSVMARNENLRSAASVVAFLGKTTIALFAEGFSSATADKTIVAFSTALCYHSGAGTAIIASNCVACSI
ncbi:hypothetical protein HUU39_21505 [candidate division KSB1 bacterium]|nr:hypothetical protein [bacterium]NUM67810.1 hypothetical protein [candidate division KSB1 bacterium]